MWSSSRFSAGEWIQVRSKEEILATLDDSGRLDELPFMPEMFQFCGQRFRVFRRAHKTCDPPNGLRGRRMACAVHLEDVRCSGEAHGGCQSGCLIFWKDAWLKRDGDSQSFESERANARRVDARPDESSNGSEQAVWCGARSPKDQTNAEEPIYVCQSTRLAAATRVLRWWDLRQYVEDILSGNVRPGQMIASFFPFLCGKLAGSGVGLGSLRWVYDRFQNIWGGTPYPWRMGRVPHHTRTPSARLGLQPGELVRVRSYDEILETLDERGQNRGMSFDAEMVPYCNGTYRVARRINTILDERTGKIQHLKNECIQLEGVVCGACYAKYRRFCPRSLLPYWREIWLERVGSKGLEQPGCSVRTEG